MNMNGKDLKIDYGCHTPCSAAAKPVPQRLDTANPLQHVQAVKRRRSLGAGESSAGESSAFDKGTAVVSETRARRQKLDNAIDNLSAPVPTSDGDGMSGMC
jgi:hypothetical protein